MIFLEAYSLLLGYVKQELNKIQQKTTVNVSEYQNSKDNSNISAFTELYELTQRKFLRQLIQLSERAATIRSYPRLFFIDLIHEDKFKIFKHKQFLETAEIDKDDQKQKSSTDFEESSDSKKFFLCLRPMCEHDECWHYSDIFVLYPTILSSNCLYLHRMISILNNGNYSSEFGFLFSEKGQSLLNEIKEKAELESTNISDSYNSFRNFFIDKYEKNDFYYRYETNPRENFSGLNKYELKSGKILWLCPFHAQILSGKLISDHKVSINNQSHEKNKFFQYLNQVNINLI